LNTSNTKKSLPPPKAPQYDGTYRLVNKKSGKLASSSNWLIDLAAYAVDLSDYGGISALLPQEKAMKLLASNLLKPFKRHKPESSIAGLESTSRDIREVARNAGPYIAYFFITKIIKNKDPETVNHKGFRAWLMDALAEPKSSLNQYLKTTQFSALVELKRSDDWWIDRLKTESKSKRRA
jgi:hypothetical protein